MALDGDPSFTLKVHVIEHLSLHVLRAHRVGVFKQTVGKRRLAVVDMGYDAEISYILHYRFFSMKQGCILWFQDAKLLKLRRPHNSGSDFQETGCTIAVSAKKCKFPANGTFFAEYEIVMPKLLQRGQVCCPVLDYATEHLPSQFFKPVGSRSTRFAVFNQFHK